MTLDELMLEMSLEVVGAALFGGQLGSEGKAWCPQCPLHFSVVVKRAQQPFHYRMATDSERQRLTESLQAIDAAVDVLVRSHRDNLTRERVPSPCCCRLARRLITDDRCAMRWSRSSWRVTKQWLPRSRGPGCCWRLTQRPCGPLLKRSTRATSICRADGELDDLRLTKAVVRRVPAALPAGLGDQQAVPGAGPTGWVSRFPPAQP